MQNFAVRLLPVLESKMRDSRSISSRAGRLFSEADGRFIIGHLDADKRYHVTILRTTETDVKGRAGRHDKTTVARQRVSVGRVRV